MKKVTIAILIACMVLAFSGCKSIKSQASAQGALKSDATETAEPGDEVGDGGAVSTGGENADLPKDLQAMFRSCAQLVSYLAVSTYTVDMQNLSAEDFWLIMSLVAYAEKPDTVGEFGTIDLEYDVVCDIAEAFLSETLSISGMPEPKDIYSASYVAAEKLYELQPVSISDIVPELVGLDQTDASGKKFLMRIKLIDTQERIKKTEWHVSLEVWDDEEDHFFPYKIVKVWHVD